jgi:hypothetical protein
MKQARCKKKRRRGVDMNHEEANGEWIASEYRKIALLNYRHDLMNKLAECADKISEIDNQIGKGVPIV